MSKLSLRPYQQEAVDIAAASIAFGSDNLFIDAPTSFGKQYVIAGLCEEFRDKTILIKLTFSELVYQLAETFDEIGMEYSVIKAGEDKKFNPNARVHIVMAQTLVRRLDKLDFNVDLIISDEGHVHNGSATSIKILEKFKPKEQIFLSATPYDSQGFAFAGSEIIRTKTTAELVKEGFLSHIDYYVPSYFEKKNYDNIPKHMGEYKDAEITKLITSKEHVNEIISAMNAIDAKNRKTLVFCSNIEQVDVITDALQKAGYDAYGYHSKVPKDSQEKIMESFKNNTPLKPFKEERTLLDENINEVVADREPVRCLVSVNKLSIGFSVTDVDLGVIVRASLVKSLVGVQIPGRLRRTDTNLEKLIKKYQKKDKQ